ncbi:hypothetical protein AB0J01_27650 [Streptomyces sp. NPDC050204]|uniref:hypothetical protein n=1 Tax=Streptomyces sp. NPDC050204 TaxID=3155514 RepID=UPI003421AFB9
MTRVRRITDQLLPLLIALGGLIVGRLALGAAAGHGANLLWQAGTALVAYTLTVALLGRIGGDDPHEAVADATRALAYVIQAAVTGALQLLCSTVQLLALLCGDLAALATAPATS